jgi:hypothetical protein
MHYFNGFKIEIEQSESLGWDFVASDSRGIGLAGFDLNSENELQVLAHIKSKLETLDGKPIIPKSSRKEKEADAPKRRKVAVKIPEPIFFE